MLKILQQIHVNLSIFFSRTHLHIRFTLGTPAETETVDSPPSDTRQKLLSNEPNPTTQATN